MQLIFSFNFEEYELSISQLEDRIFLKIDMNESEIYSQSFPNSCKINDYEISKISDIKILLNSSSVMTTISFFKNNVKKSEVGINYLTKRISLTKDFKDKESIIIPHKKNSVEKRVFFYTGFDQTLYIPKVAKKVTVECWGAGGGSAGTTSTTFYNTGYGGGGGYTKGELLNVAGKSFNVIVGEAGLAIPWNVVSIPVGYGGGGGVYPNNSGWGTSTGGGRSAIQLEIDGKMEDIITAGGGGGGSGNQYSGDIAYYGIGGGGAGGGQAAGDALQEPSISYAYAGTGSSLYSPGVNGYHQTGSSFIYNADEYKGGGGSQLGAGGGGGFYGGGCGGSITFTPSSSVSQLNQLTVFDGLVTWLDASDTSKVVELDGAVTQWNDKSANKLIFTPFSGTTTYSLDDFSGKPSINFENSIMSAPLAVGTFNDGVTFFTVMTNNANSSTSYNCSGLSRNIKDSINGYPVPWDNYNNRRVTASDGSSTSSSLDFRNSFDKSLYIYQSGLNLIPQEWFNGLLYPFANNKTNKYADYGDTLLVGGRIDKLTIFNGQIAEILVFNKYLTKNDIDKVQSYLADKWGLTVTGIPSSSELTFTSPGDYWMFGGGGGGCSFTNSSYVNELELLIGDKSFPGGNDKIPDDVRGRVGNGAKATCKVNNGMNGQSGYVLVNIEY